MLTSVLFTRVSANAKTGPIPVSMSAKTTCPDSCPLKHGGCYAGGGPINLHWLRLTAGKVGLKWEAFLQQVRTLPRSQIWRHNQAGDLPGENNAIEAKALASLVQANTGRHGFTYTHKPTLKGQAPAKVIAANKKAIASANKGGFTVNLSADTLSEADELASLGIAPVVTLLSSHQTENTVTPAGRKVIVCPATQREFVTCQTCQLCQKAGRSVIVGFPAHGVQTKKADAIAQS